VSAGIPEEERAAVLARSTESRLNADVARLKSRRGYSTAEVGAVGASESALNCQSDVAGRQIQSENLQPVLLGTLAKGNVGRDLLGWLPHAAGHSAACAIFGSTAAGGARRLRLGYLVRYERASRDRRTDWRDASAHSEQGDGNRTEWFCPVHIGSIRQKSLIGALNFMTVPILRQPQFLVRSVRKFRVLPAFGP